MSFLAPVIAISLLIIVHEAGHYLVAKWCKMRVERFSLGFGPPLAGWHRKGTYFQIAPIFFGGFVEIRGMNIAEDVDPDDTHAYPNRPVWQRFLTIFAGPATNYLFAIFLAFVLFTTAGVESGTVWYTITDVQTTSEAYGRVQPGDRVVSIQRAGDTEPIPVYIAHQGEASTSMAELVHKSQGVPFRLTVLRDGNPHTFEVAARQDPEHVWDQETGEQQYLLGVMLGADYERVPVGVLTSTGYALAYPVEQTQRIIDMLRDIASGREEGRLTGPVGIAQEFKRAFSEGWITGLQLFMGLSVWLGLVNLFPLPALDGGRLAFLVYEMATRRRANPKVEATIHMVGIMALLVLMVVVTFNDCSRLLFGA